MYVDKLTAKSVRQKRLSTGMAPVPYHLYDGHATLIGGTADRAAVKTLLQSDYRHACIRSRGLPRVALYAHFVEHMIGFKFVYLHVHNAGDGALCSIVAPKDAPLTPE